ncbi:MAG: DUF4340 domain-containing protein [Ghiorsea sp.]
MIKKVALILVLLGLLIGLVVQQSPNETAQDLPTLPVIQWDDVEAFDIQWHQKVKISAKKEGNIWLLVDAEAPTKLNGNHVEQLLMSLQDMKPKRVASFKAEHHVRFSVAETDNLLTLRNANGDTLLAIYVGKPATDLVSTYIRLAGEDTVVTVDKTLTWQVNRTQDAWLLKEESSE